MEVKIGIIGAGHMGTYHINVLSSLENVNIIGFFDINKENIKKTIDQFGIKCYSSKESLIDDSDAIILASSTSTHYEISKIIFSKKKHLLVEKPIAASYDEAKSMIDLAHDNNVILHIGHVERFNSAIIELKKYIETPYLWEARRVGTGGRIVDVGVIWDLMIHDIDICLRILNSDIEDISVHVLKGISTHHEDVANASIAFKNGCVANFITSRISQRKDRTLSISQKNSYIDLDFTTQDISIYKNIVSDVKTSNKNIRYSQNNNYERVFIMKHNPLELQAKHFVNSIINNISSYESNLMDLKTIEVTQKIVSSIKNKI